MSADKFNRVPLKCSKCESLWMVERHAREMFISPYRGQQPLYSGATKLRIYCAECGGLVWKEGMDLREKKDK